jgi:uncharacterized membrane protein
VVATDDSRRLVVTSAGPWQGSAFRLDGDDVVVGREDGADVLLADPHVSRRHAMLSRDGPDIVLRDLNSTAGTTVNGVSVTGARVLRDGDVIGLGGLSVRYEAPRPPAPSPEPQMHFRDQSAGSINNVQGNQYHQYLSERDSLLRDIASTRTRARGLVIVGFVLFLIGFVVFAVPLLQFFGFVADGLGSESPPDFESFDFFGPQVLGIPLAMWGWALAAVGTFLIMIGVVLHVVASSRRRRGQAELERRWSPGPRPPTEGFHGLHHP